MYELFEHTADLGLRVRAGDLESLFAEAGEALFAAILDVSQVQVSQTEQIRIEGTDREYLLFDWLNELLYRFDAEKMLFCRFAVQFDSAGLSAEAFGESYAPDRHELEHEVKAITYHGLRVEQTQDGWLAEVIVDI